MKRCAAQIRVLKYRKMIINGMHSIAISMTLVFQKPKAAMEDFKFDIWGTEV